MTELIEEEGEGFRTRNTNRLVYKLHLTLQNAKCSRLPTAVLNIESERPSNSVWVDDFLINMFHNKTSGKTFRVAELSFKHLTRFHRNDIITNLLRFRLTLAFHRNLLSQFLLTSSSTIFLVIKRRKSKSQMMVPSISLTMVHQVQAYLRRTCWGIEKVSWLENVSERRKNWNIAVHLRGNSLRSTVHHGDFCQGENKNKISWNNNHTTLNYQFVPYKKNSVSRGYSEFSPVVML